MTHLQTIAAVVGILGYVTTIGAVALRAMRRYVTRLTTDIVSPLADKVEHMADDVAEIRKQLDSHETVISPRQVWPWG